MISISKQFQTLYEIALTIGDGKNHQEAIDHALSVYFQKLNCFAGAIFKTEIADNKVWYKQADSNPPNVEINLLYQQLTGSFLNSPKNDASDFDEKEMTVLKYFDDGSHGYLFPLPGYGIMTLIRKGDVFSEQFIQNLLPLNKKLAGFLANFEANKNFSLLSEAMEAIDIAILITDAAGYICWVSRAWCSLNAFTREQTHGKYSTLINSEKYRNDFFDKMELTLKSGKKWQGSLSVTRNDGSAYMADVSMIPVFNQNKQVTHFISISQDITKNQDAGDVLQKNETLLRTLVQSIPDLIWLKDKAGVYLACNPKFEKFFGASEAEIVGKTDYDFVDKEMGDFFRAHDKLAMEAGEPTINEEEVTFADGGHKALLETIKTPMIDQQGNVLGVLGIARDITQRKLAEDALKESIQRFQEIANLLPQPIWEADVNGKFIFANKAGFEVLGYKPEQVEQGLSFLEVIAPHDRARIAINFEKKLKGIETNDFEYSCIKRSGETFPVLIYTSPIRRNGLIIGVRGITLDVSGLKKAQENLKYFSSLQEVLIHISTKYINVSIDEIDLALQDALREICEFVSADRAYIFDYDFEKQITTNTYEWCREGVEPQIGNLQEVPLEAIPLWVEKHVKAETVYIADVFALPPGDDLREVLEPQDIKSLIAVPMMHSGKCLGFIGFDSVRTHHTYSDKERSILEVFAQMVVNFQLRSKTEKELKLAKEKAESAEKAQFNFLSTMSHEIRTPLNAVVGLTNILLMDNPRHQQLNNLNTLKFSSQNLLNIINDILDYNKLAIGKVILEQADFSIQDILKGMHYAMSSLAKAKHIELEYSIDKNIPGVIVGDSTRLLQIINNLVSNALKFTKSGGVYIDVSQTKISSKRVRLLIKVRDTGIGIPGDKFDDVFEEFKQTSSSTTREYGGTGLGLSIVKKLLQSMGSDIKLESVVGKGSVFSFEIEFLIGDTKKILNRSETKVVFDDALKGVNVLLVEDNKINQMVASKFLSEWKCIVDVADNGKIAIEKLLQNKYDVVLMDLQMPVMDGYTASTEIRKLKDPVKSKIPIIALSASALGEIETRARKYGMDDFVTKPFVPEVLFKSLKRFTHK